jgi:hypothetical protein
MRRKLDFDGEFDEFISIKRQRYNNAVSVGKLKTDGLGIVTPPTPVLNAPALGGGIATSIVTSGGNPTPVLNAPALGGGMATGIVTTGGNPTPVLNLPSLPIGNIMLTSPSSSGSTTSSSGSTNSPTPTPTSTGTTTTSSSTPTFTEGILIGSGLLGGALNNATSSTPRFGGGGIEAEENQEQDQETKEQQIPVYNKPKSTPTSHAFFKPLIIGSVILGAAYLMLKAK